MVIYEIHLQIDRDILEAFNAWLAPHIQAILTFDGFQGAYLMEDRQQNNASSHALTVSYQVDTYEHLENYLNNGAATMRQDGSDKFPGQFTASRNIMNVNNIFSATT